MNRKNCENCDGQFSRQVSELVVVLTKVTESGGAFTDVVELGRVLLPDVT